MIFLLAMVMRFLAKMSRRGRQRAAKITCVATLALVTRKVFILSRKIQHVEFLAIFSFKLSFCLWVDGDATTCQKMGSPS